MPADLRAELLGNPDLLAAAEGTDSASDAAQIKRLASLSPLEYERVRVQEAKRLGVRVEVLDQEVKDCRGDKVYLAQGTAVEIADPVRWPDEVCGSALADGLLAEIQRYVGVPKEAAAVTVLWMLNAHTHDAAAISPILAITSPVLACGKTTLLTLLHRLCPRPMAASNITAAALFRAVEKFSPTLLIDEADTFLKGSDELRGILNSGHNRATAYVVRTTGEDYEPRLFGTWSPKAVAMIGQLPDTLASRAIEIRMRRIPPGASVEELRAGRLQYLEPFQRQAWTWGQDHIELLRAADPCMPNGMRGRTADNWRPLLAIADALGDDWPQRARDAAQAYCASVGEQPKGVQLLADIREILVDHAADRIPSADLASKLGHMEDRSWPEWRDGKPITTRQVARLLAPFGVAPRTIRFEADSAKGYFVSDFTDAFLRYLPDRSVTALQTRETGSSEPDPSVTECFGVTDGKEGNTLPTGRCDGVTDQEADLGETSEVEVEL